MSNPSTVKAIIDSWVQKSELETNAFNKYISLWIAFNAYFSSATNEIYERDAIKKIKDNNKLEQWYLSIANSKEVSILLAISPLLNIKKNEEVVSTRENYSSIVETLYQIRNNLFHGNKSEHVERDTDVINAALPILKKLVIHCQTNFDQLEF